MNKIIKAILKLIKKGASNKKQTKEIYLSLHLLLITILDKIVIHLLRNHPGIAL